MSEAASDEVRQVNRAGASTAARRDRMPRQWTALRAGIVRWTTFGIALCGLLVVGATPAQSAETHVLIVAGLGGEPQYETRFRSQARALGQAAERLTGDAAKVTVLSAESANRDAVRRELRALAGRAKREDRLVIVLIGHGTYDGTDYRFNLPGPDLTASELSGLFDRIPAREQLIVNGTSASGATAERWQREGRIVITATKSGGERTATRFAQYWIEAMSTSAADVNRDDVVTAQEAFEFADRRVAESFKADIALATEHARLEGKGAERFMVARFGNAILASSDEALSALYTQRAGVERDLQALKERKRALPSEQYYDELEGVLVRLSLLQREIDARQAVLQGGTE